MSRPVILVTGATSGFGAATARYFAANGWKVVATGRRRERLDELADEFDRGTISGLEMDLMDLESIKTAINNIPDDFGPVKCLFNNGGLALGSKPVPEARFEDWRQMVETNIMGLVHMSQLMVPQLKQAGRGASIINVGSIAGRFAYPGGNFYGASKAFVRQFSYELRCDLAGSDIRVTSFEPGMAKSEFMQVRSYGDAQANEDLYKGTTPILPGDVAQIIWFIANLPPHLNVNALELMPLVQVPAIPTILRKH